MLLISKLRLIILQFFILTGIKSMSMISKLRLIILQFFILTGIKSMSRKYERKNKKNYHQWVLDHKSEILELPSKQRTDYVMGKLNNELNLNMQRYNVYQLLYRNGMIEHKHDKITVYENPIETTTDTTTDEPVVYSNDSFRNALCHFFGPDLLDKIIFINSDSNSDSDDNDY